LPILRQIGGTVRIAAFILTIPLVICVFGQSFVLYSLGGLAGTVADYGTGTMGIAVAFLAFVGAAFVLPLPSVAAVIYLLAAVLALVPTLEGWSTGLNLWALLLLVLAFLSWTGRTVSAESNEEGETPQEA
jgi:hypothetical protein